METARNPFPPEFDTFRGPFYKETHAEEGPSDRFFGVN